MKSQPYLATQRDVLQVITQVRGVVTFIEEFSLNYQDVTVVSDTGLRQLVTLPDISFVMQSNDFFDWADPETGLRGVNEPPQPEKVLRLWADDLLTVSHDGAWVMLLNSNEPFDEKWIKTLFPPDDADFTPNVCFMGVYPDRIPSAGPRSPESEMLTPNAALNIEDFRSLLHP